MKRYLRLDRLLGAHSLCGRPTSCIVTVPPVMNYWRRVLSVADTEVVLQPPQRHLTASTSAFPEILQIWLNGNKWVCFRR